MKKLEFISSADLHMNEDQETSMTLNYYNKTAIEFNRDTVTVQFDEMQNMLIKYLSPGAHILDLGCGSGRDSKAFLKKGFKVTSIDGSSELCKIASKYIGQDVICKTFQSLDEENAFDAVWACASILHVPLANLQNIISKINDALKPNGYLYASFKYGNFEGERNGRYFTDMTEERLKIILKAFSNLKIVEITVTGDARAGRESEKWLNVIIKSNF